MHYIWSLILNTEIEYLIMKFIFQFVTLREVYQPLEGILSDSSKHILSDSGVEFLVLKSKALSLILPFQIKQDFLH